MRIRCSSWKERETKRWNVSHLFRFAQRFKREFSRMIEIDKLALYNYIYTLVCQCFPALPRLTHVNTFLLLAGRSTRFWPLSEKTLFPVCGKTLLEHQVARLREGGVGNIILVGGEHNLEDARKIFPDLPTVKQENLKLGMRGAVLSALA